MRTRSAVISGVGQDWKVVDVELGDPGPGEAIVQMKAAGICHSDDHFGSGDAIPTAETEAMMAAAGIAPMRFFPLIGGHEGAGVVVEVGPGVTDVAPGDHVGISFIPSCGRCRWCVSGQSYICDNGAELFSTGMVGGGPDKRLVDGQPALAMMQAGTFSEHAIVSTGSLIKIDADISFEAASLVSCGVTTGWGSAVHRADVRPGDTVVVVGVGGVGVNAVQGARAAGARRIIAVDPVAFKRESALQFGATHTTPSIEEAWLLTQELTWGVMADKVILTPGVLHVELMPTAMALTRKGGTCVVVGITPQTDGSVPISLADLVSSAKEIKGCLYGNMNPRASMPQLLGLYRDGQLMLDELVTNTYPLDDINKAFADMRDGVNLRGLLRFD